MFAQFERDPTPDWDTLYIGIDALVDAGEERLAEVAGWMCEHRKWPVFTAIAGEFSWMKLYEESGGDAACYDYPHARLPDWLVDHLCPTLHERCFDHVGTFRNAMLAVSTALHLRSFEDDPTPNYAAASECADWLESHERRPELVKGIRWLCEWERWPVDCGLDGRRAARVPLAFRAAL